MKDFNWKIYLFLNPDLNQNCNKNEATQHYINHGRFENRPYKCILLPQDFNWKTYISINPDLKDCNEKEAIKHYLIYGYYENRQYKFKTICHITHNYGGGTDVYINNIQNIFPNYSHLIIKIVDLNNVIIDDKNYALHSLNDFLNTSELLFVHNLLYTSTNNNNYEMIINENIVSILKNNPIKKLLIVHDYYLLFPNCPNPVKSKNLIPSEENINKTKDFFTIFEKVYFNSENCYSNYLKYANKIENAVILNNVPDIDFYNPRIYPPNKTKYNIGLIGDIGCEHKGRDIAINILELFHNNNNNEYSFVIFGNFGKNYPNLTITGKYNNDNIFNLIREYDIDYFLFLSTFEETYSFTLSLAIHTGLPIIYNNIGSYPERLKEYNNCFSFEENNYTQIVDLLNNLKGKNNSVSVKNKIHHKPTLYKNMPEWNEYLKINDDYNFDLTNIRYNLNHKAVCFIHICSIENGEKNSGKDILMDQIDYIKKSGLYDKLDYIFITMIGKHIKLINDYKIKLIYYSPSPNEWEFPHMQRIKYFADNIKRNIKILQIHTKGVLNKPNSLEWRKYLEYFLIEKNELCLDLLEKYKCVGVNAQYYFDDINKYRNHFSGNFWWSNSSHLKTLPLLQVNEDRFIVEHWLFGNLEKNDYRYFLSLHHTPFDLYKNAILPENYNVEMIKSNISNNMKIDFIKKRPIFGVYFICCIGNYLDIVKKQLCKLIQSKLYDLSDEIFCFVCQEKQDCIDLLKQFKKIKIISTQENLYEKFAINNYKKYLPVNDNYYLYYMHSKGVTKSEKCFEDWRNLCDYFTIEKWRLSIELLEYYDCVGTNLKNFPKKHYSGNFWWSKSEHLNRLKNVNDGYLSTEMYVCSYMKTNYVSIYQSYVNHGGAEYCPALYNQLTDDELLEKICITPDFNEGDKKCIMYCGNINKDNEPMIL
jgi:hypothetical protein